MSRNFQSPHSAHRNPLEHKRPLLKSVKTVPPLDLFKITLLSVILTSKALMGLHQFFTNISGLFRFANTIPDSNFFYLGHPPFGGSSDSVPSTTTAFYNYATTSSICLQILPEIIPNICSTLISTLPSPFRLQFQNTPGLHLEDHTLEFLKHY